MNISALQKARYEYKSKLPEVLQCAVDNIKVELGEKTHAVADEKELSALFAKTYGLPKATLVKGSNPKARNKVNVGVILSGGQAPGGHNVIAGLFDAIMEGNSDSKLIGFHNGPGGLVAGDYEVLTKEKIDAYRNTGGFDLIGSGRTKIETKEQIAASIETAKKLDLDAIVIIGGDDSNTNAALLADYFMAANIKTHVVGVPKTIDGDLKNDMIETSFGFDTAAKCYSELISNLARDSLSAKKYWHFVKLMGRSASHIALECALQTQPNITLISEEVEAKAMTLKQITTYICDIIAKRAQKGIDYGVILIPEGVVEFIPEMKVLIAELNDTMAKNEAVFATLTTYEDKKAWLNGRLTAQAYETLCDLPNEIAAEFLGQRDPHGNVQVSLIGTEKLFALMCQNELNIRKNHGEYKGNFTAVPHFFGYEGRAAFPSNFDANYCYALGKTAFILLANGLTGYLSSVRNLKANATSWKAGGVPLTSMMNMEKRGGKLKPVIKKALVDLNGKPFKYFASNRDTWAIENAYVYTGPVQYFGPEAVCDSVTKTLELEQQ